MTILLIAALGTTLPCLYIWRSDDLRTDSVK